ncbi:MAG: KilA-N domain-containing protein [Bacteroidota bacterium]
MAEKINIEGQEISIKSVNDQDYISLTDMAKAEREESEPRFIIRAWIQSPDTPALLNEWESIFNPHFKRDLWRTFSEYVLTSRKSLTIKRYIEMVQPLGIVSMSGRYGGTFAHRDIAFEFGTWLSPRFKIRLIRDYQRLRSEEAARKRLEWNAGRELARLNYPIQTAAIQEVTGSLSEKRKGGVYAENADMINKIVFGMTAKQWRVQNPNLKGNMRDHATTTQNTIIGNLESFNSELIRKGASEEAREKALGEMAAFQEKILGQKYLPD